MLIKRRLRLLTPLLAGKHSRDEHGPKRVFVKVDPPKGADETRVYIASQLPRWSWAFLEARDALELSDVAVSAILPCRYFSTKRTSTYNREFSRDGKRGKEKFESVPSNQVIEMQFTLSKHIPPNTDSLGRFTRVPEEDDRAAFLVEFARRAGEGEVSEPIEVGQNLFVLKVVYRMDQPARSFDDQSVQDEIRNRLANLRILRMRSKILLSKLENMYTWPPELFRQGR